MNSKAHYEFRQAQIRDTTVDALKAFKEYGFDVFHRSPETAAVHMQQAANALATVQSKAAIQALIQALENAIK